MEDPNLFFLSLILLPLGLLTLLSSHHPFPPRQDCDHGPGLQGWGGGAIGGKPPSRRRSGGVREPFASVSVGTDLIAAAPRRFPPEGSQLGRRRRVQVLHHHSQRLIQASVFYLALFDLILQEKKVVIFGLPGAYTGVCSAQHVPSYKNNSDKFKAKGIDHVICVAINDPYVMNGWAEKLQAKDDIEFYGDFDGSFHKSLDLGIDLSAALLGHRSHRWSAYVIDGKVKILNVEKAPSEFKVSGADVILGQI
ncbi:peroxiredoxin IIF [Actinidia rufa]|uniref:Glutaredoxin-dependent peroxiredoxin n=1 Tax=Actinidia rufa TaxID=165716 RepID=A0A7J0GTK1_9ERIC|nr:peroxiredoxin IIF [Actinidia rufa]